MHKPVFKNAILSGSLAKRRLCLGPAGVINCTPLKKKKKKMLFCELKLEMFKEIKTLKVACMYIPCLFSQLSFHFLMF